MSGIGQAGGHHVARRDLRTLHVDLFLVVEAEHVESFQHADKLVAESILEGGALRLDPARNQQNFLMLHVDHFHGADLGEVEHLRLGEGRGREPLSVFPNDGRIEALLDGCPDRKVGRELVTFDGDVRAVADADLLDLVEEMILRVAREHVRHARFHTTTDEGEQAFLLPIFGLVELVIAQFDPGLVERVAGMRRRERHGHIHISRADVEGRVEDLLVVNWIHRVHDQVNPVFLRQVFDHALLAGVNELHREAFRAAHFLLDFLGARLVVVGQDDLLHPFTRFGNRGDCLAHPSNTDEQYFHDPFSPLVL